MRKREKLKTVDCLLTETHIAEGERHNSRTCPVALLLQDRLRSGFFVRVTNYSVGIEDYNGFRWRTEHPLAVREFVNEFDSGGSPGPISFRIQLPERAVL